MREFLIITCIIAVLVTLVTGVIWLMAIPLQVSGKMALLLGIISVFFLFPGIACFLVMVRGEKGMSRAKRTLYGARGLGMIACAVAFLLPFAFAGAGLLEGGIVFGAGSALWLGTIVAYDIVETREVQSRPDYYAEETPGNGGKGE